MPAQDTEVISVVIRVRNAAADLRRCLSALKTQEMPGNTRLDLVVVDNESTDASAEVAAGFGARLVSISTADFTWGRALNRGIAAAEGDTIILLSADASPADSAFLTQLLEPLADPRVAAVYGRQIPRDDAPIDERVRLRRTFGNGRYSSDESQIDPKLRDVISNACAAIRRSCWERQRFVEQQAGAEDRTWAAALVSTGWRWVYQPSAVVYHSHADRVCGLAYRLWELEKASAAATTGSIGVSKVLRAVVHMSAMRLVNCLSRAEPVRIRAAGAWRLPAEAAAFTLIALAEIMGFDEKRMRRMMWR